MLNSASSLCLRTETASFLVKTQAGGWVWDYNTASPYIYYLSSDSPTNPQYTQLTHLQHETMGRTAIFNADATLGWMWDVGPAPYVYLLSADAPTDPQSVQLTQLTNARYSAFSADASVGWIWDSNVTDPYIYYLSGVPTPEPPQPLYWRSGLGGVWVNSTFNSLLAFSKALEPAFLSSRVLFDPYCRDDCCTSTDNETVYSVRAIPFAEYVVQKKQHYTPAFTNGIGGIIAALDAQIGQEGLIGIGGAYAFNRVHYGEALGHANLQEEVGVVYGSWGRNGFFLDAACWGGGYQLRSLRKTAGQTTARAHLGGASALSPTWNLAK